MTEAGLSTSQGWLRGVVADGVAGEMDGAGELRPQADEAANHEEGGANVEAGEHVEQMRGGGVVGTVVEGEQNVVGVPRSDQGAAKELRARAEGGVGGERSGGGHERGGCG